MREDFEKEFAIEQMGLLPIGGTVTVRVLDRTRGGLRPVAHFVRGGSGFVSVATTLHLLGDDYTRLDTSDEVLLVDTGSGWTAEQVYGWGSVLGAKFFLEKPVNP